MILKTENVFRLHRETLESRELERRWCVIKKSTLLSAVKNFVFCFRNKIVLINVIID